MLYVAMSEDVVEKPVCTILYRQSSLETRLSPVHLSEESEDDEDDLPKIVGCKIKPEFIEKNKHFLPIEPSEDVNKMEKLSESLGDVNVDSTKKIDKSEIDANDGNVADEVKVILKNAKISCNKDVVPEETTPASLQGTRNEFKNELNYMLKKNKVCEGNREKAVGFNKVRIDEDDKEKKVLEYTTGTLRALEVTRQEKGGVNDNQQETVGSTSKNYNEMATLRPKSPRPVAVRGEKEDSIWDKIGTLGRKKRIKEVQEVQAEGKYAIDSPGCATTPILPPEDYNLDDNEERCMIDPRAYEDPKFNELLSVLKDWINDELASQRIIVQDIAEDLYDGQVLQKLLEKLTGDKLDVPEVTQSEEGQKQKLMVVLDHFNQILGIHRRDNKWSIEAIHSKNIVSITHLLVALARHFRPPVRLPEHVSVNVVVVQKVKGQLNHKTVTESLTKAYDDVGMRCERDAFDTLFDHAPDKLQVVKKSLVTFVNKHLNKMNFEVTEIESQFHDGVYLIMLMGLLEGFFVPHYSFHLTPHEFEQKVHNVNFAFELMEEVGLKRPKARPEDVVNMDLKSTLRVLYTLFSNYKGVL